MSLGPFAGHAPAGPNLFESAVDEDFPFHCAITTATGNLQFTRFLEYLGSFIIPRRSIWNGPASAARRVQLDTFQKEHEQILQAIEGRAENVKDLQTRSAAAAGTSHPAILQLLPNEEKAGEAKLVHDGDHDFWLLEFAGGKPPVPFKLVVVGAGAE